MGKSLSPQYKKDMTINLSLHLSQSDLHLVTTRHFQGLNAGHQSYWSRLSSRDSRVLVPKIRCIISLSYHMGSRTRSTPYNQCAPPPPHQHHQRTPTSTTSITSPRRRTSRSSCFSPPHRSNPNFDPFIFHFRLLFLPSSVLFSPNSIPCLALPSPRLPSTTNRNLLVFATD